ncbi:sodium:proton antiporter [Kribbella sp. VKM Ac-2568]|uniref:cation:proton antiporter n=1 Tax=Kribbella sp. VKM Ac-2568 TaxID=2512219 RepID=UPI0010E731BC|nr:cation:proton antiporter [Kribbella sp. VKM Ac-2568]TCM40396.1 NhaP-type Na+/H+ or K+/H+ antiporter [Kribbella sp. VKM Ac-2568]
MTEATFAVLTLLILVWAVTSGLLARRNITGPLVFAVAGYALGNPDWGPLSVDVEAPSVHLIAELALALLLFSDAARVNLSRLKRDIRLPGRLLAIGLPLSLVLGSLLAAWLFDDFTWALAGFVGATLAPTDAALSAQVINDRRIPMRLRRALNVESGLNDGIVTPVVTFSLAVAAGQLGVESHDGVSDHGGGALLELAVGVIVGLAVGAASARLMTVGSRRRWMTTGARRLGTLAAALASFALAVAFSGNGFIAAFVAGIAFRAALDEEIVDTDSVVEPPELLGEVLALAVWFLFGAALVPIAMHNFDLTLLAYAVLSLTVVRIVPVALSLLGTGLDRTTVLFVGWFGPRGLASIVFALLAIEQLGEIPVVEQAVSVVALTVLLSVVLHGVTAGPLGSRYVRLEQADEEAGAGPRSRRLAHHSPESPSPRRSDQP